MGLYEADGVGYSATQKVVYMHIMFAGMIGGTELMVIAVAAMVLFGARKIPEFAKGLGQAVKEFKKASNEDEQAAPPAAATSTQPPVTK